MMAPDDRPDRSPGEPDEASGESGEPGAVELPLDGTLDLHQFEPREVRDLVRDYLDECLRRGILDVRIVHGKGVGVLRRIVHGVLDRHPAVTWYGHQEGAGSWGATVVRLDPGARGGGGPQEPDSGREGAAP